MPSVRASTLVRSIAIATAIAAAFAAHAQSPARPPGRPSPPPAAPAAAPPAASPIRLEPPRFDLGAVPPRSIHERTFRIVNGSTAAVRIRAATPNCRCTSLSDVVGKVVPAGGSIEMTAAFDAPANPGVKDARVTIAFDGNVPPLTAEIRGDVTLPIRVDPAFVDALENRTTGTVELRSLDGRPFRVLSAGGRPPVHVGGAPAEPQATQRLVWNLAGVPCETMPLWWIVATDHPDCPIVPLRVRHECTGSRADSARFSRFWIPNEQLVNLGRISAATEVPFQIDHYNPRGRGRVQQPQWREVRSVELSSPQVAVELLGTRPAGDGGEVLMLRFTPRPGAAPGPFESSLWITTATGTGPVPVAGLLAP